MLQQLTNHTQPITEKKQKRPYSVNFPILGEIKYKIWTQNSHDQAQNKTSWKSMQLLFLPNETNMRGTSDQIEIYFRLIYGDHFLIRFITRVKQRHPVAADFTTGNLPWVINGIIINICGIQWQ